MLLAGATTGERRRAVPVAVYLLPRTIGEFIGASRKSYADAVYLQERTWLAQNGSTYLPSRMALEITPGITNFSELAVRWWRRCEGITRCSERLSFCRRNP